MKLFFETDWSACLLIPTIGIGVVAECTCETCQEPIYGAWISWGMWTAGIYLA